jgi:hypothetical protein
VGVHHVFPVFVSVFDLSYLSHQNLPTDITIHIHLHISKSINMVSYDDREEDESPIDFDFSVFDKPEYEYPPVPPGEAEETVVGSEMEVEEHEQSAMEVESDDCGIATSQV